jgi:hypothetical protein
VLYVVIEALCRFRNDTTCPSQFNITPHEGTLRAGTFINASIVTPGIGMVIVQSNLTMAGTYDIAVLSQVRAFAVACVPFIA